MVDGWRPGIRVGMLVANLTRKQPPGSPMTRPAPTPAVPARPEENALLQAIVDNASRPSLLRGVAASALGMSGSPAAYDVLAPLLGSHDPSLVAGAIDGLAELGDPRARSLIQALLAAGRLDERTERGARLALISLRTRR